MQSAYKDASKQEADEKKRGKNIFSCSKCKLFIEIMNHNFITKILKGLNRVLQFFPSRKKKKEKNPFFLLN